MRVHNLIFSTVIDRRSALTFRCIISKASTQTYETLYTTAKEENSCLEIEQAK